MQHYHPTPYFFLQAPAGMAPPVSSATTSFNPQMANVPSGYQPQGQALPLTQPQMDGNQLQAAPGTTSGYSVPQASMGYTDQGLPSMGQPSMPYSMPPTMDYSSFNMQSECGAWLIDVPHLAAECSWSRCCDRESALCLSFFLISGFFFSPTLCAAAS